jgi:thioester reductase-like protein
MWKESDADRTSAIPGDLRYEGAGINSKTYADMCERVDVVYHNATSMNHLESFEMSRATNIDGMQTLLRLCVTGKPKQFNYISTLNVFSSHGRAGNHVFDEFSPISNEKHLLSHGYAGSKWAAEHLVQQASARGIACNIFRLGLVAGDSQHGRYDEAQSLYRMISSCIQMGTAFKGLSGISFAPVDYVARSIVYLGTQHLGQSNIFHLPSMRETSLAECFEFYNQVSALPLKLVAYDAWLEELKTYRDAGRALPIVPLIDIQSKAQISSQMDVGESASPKLSFDCARTQTELESAGILIPKFGLDMFRLYIEAMRRMDPSLSALIRIRLQNET